MRLMSVIKRIYSEQQKRSFVESYLASGLSQQDFVNQNSIGLRTLSRWLKKYRHAIEYSINDDQLMRKHTRQRTWRDDEGNYQAEWIKTDFELEGATDKLREAAEALAEELPRQKPIKAPSHSLEDLCTTYIVTDYHMGMLSWEEETGDSWDTNIAYDLLINWFGAAIASTPDSHTGVLCQLGDFMHYDGLDAVTPMSKHVLDADTRFPKLVDMSVRLLRQVINMMLRKHQHVHVVMAEGNHDLASSVWLRCLFGALYENEPRVTVDNTHIPYYSFEWGKTSLFFHHGHKKNLKGLSKTFVGLFDELWGRTKHRYGFVGHFHHEKVIEDALMKIEQFPTLAAKDAYAVRGGWLSKREASAITFSKQYGRVGRVDITPDMVKGHELE